MARDRGQSARGRNSKEVVDPDPLLLELLVQVVANGLGSLITHAGKSVFGRQRADGLWDSPSPVEGLIRHVATLERLVNEASSLVGPGIKREMGGVLLLTRESLSRHGELLESLLAEVRELNRLSVSPRIEESADRSGNTRSGRRSKLPAEFKTHLRFITRRLKSARTASYSGQAFLEVKSAITGMRQCLEYLERDG